MKILKLVVYEGDAKEIKKQLSKSLPDGTHKLATTITVKTFTETIDTNFMRYFLGNDCNLKEKLK